MRILLGAQSVLRELHVMLPCLTMGLDERETEKRCSPARTDEARRVAVEGTTGAGYRCWKRRRLTLHDTSGGALAQSRMDRVEVVEVEREPR